MLAIRSFTLSLIISPIHPVIESTLPESHCSRSRVYVTVGRPSARLSVCPVDRQQQRRPVGLLLIAKVCSRYRSIVAGALLQAPALSSKCG